MMLYNGYDVPELPPVSEPKPKYVLIIDQYLNDTDCDGRCLNCDNYGTDDCPDRH